MHPPIAEPCEQTGHNTCWAEHIKNLAGAHPCSAHKLFAHLETSRLGKGQVAAFLRNYDAHASALRRLLLKSASIMPEEACGFVLENVRNEYGNGNPNERHQLQLLDLAHKAGVAEQFKRAAVTPGVRSFIRQVTPLYYPLRDRASKCRCRAAIAAGAITATEILAIKEFTSMQSAFARLGFGQHVWFDHVSTECGHFDESLALAFYFIERGQASDVLHGLEGVLDANVNLYDGLLQSAC